MRYDLEDRLIHFASMVIDIAEALPQTLAGRHICGQLIRAGTSPCLQYAEAQSAESRNDFIHKMKLSLKELRESLNCLRLIQIKNWIPQEKLFKSLEENNELISIFVKSLQTARKNSQA